MSDFQLDTSGAVYVPGNIPNHPRHVTMWSDLDPFTQGYLRAALESAPVRFGSAKTDPPLERPHNIFAAFSDLAPDTLAAMLKDCEGNHADEAAGRSFWRKRQSRELFPVYPPVTLYLGDDGKVCQQ